MLSQSQDNVAALLVQSEIEIKQRKFSIAGQRLDGQAAADAFIKAAQTARDLDLDPMVAAVNQLAALACAADAEHDTVRVDKPRAQIDELLGRFADHAARDPQLALTM